MTKRFQSMDGNQAAAYTSYAFTEVAGIYPITPSSPMAEWVDLWASKGMKNLFDVPVKVIEMQSEAGAAGAVHGSLQVGALTTTFTASQGLLLKIPNMYKIAGQLLPGVIHVAARSLATHALSIFGDHQDVMAARQTGFAMLASGSVQEVMDLGGVAHLSAIKSSVPFMHFFDGFRTSHEIQKIEMIDYQVFDKLLDRKAVEKFRGRALNPNNPITRGSAQNDDVYFQAGEAQNKYWEAVPDIVANYMKEISKVTGREYAPFVYYGDKDATDIIIAIGSVTEVAEEVIDYLNKKGSKTGILSVHLYRPFSAKYFLDAMPKSVKRIAVLDRTKEKGAPGEPLYLDVLSIYYGKENAPLIIGGIYGLSSKDVTPNQIIAVYDNLKNEQKNQFTIGIVDDVTFRSLKQLPEHIEVIDQSTTELLFFGLGSDGTVGASKNTIKIIGENTDLYGQSYSSYDSKKSGGVTRMHLRFGKKPIKSTYLVNTPHFVSCSQDSYLNKYDMISGLRNCGTFLLNTIETVETVQDILPNSVKIALAKKNAKLYIINAVELASEIGLGKRINTIMQSAFFKLNEQIIPYDRAQELMKKYAKKVYEIKGMEIVKMNYQAIERGGESLAEVKIDPAWANLKAEIKEVDKNRPNYIKEIADPVSLIKGYDLPVSAFEDIVDGKMVNGSTAYEKRGIAVEVPIWLSENCIQCNQCAFACPHAVIRPFLSTKDETDNSPLKTNALKAIGKDFVDLDYSIQISTLDCTGCNLCVEVCPGKKGVKALAAKPIQENIDAGQQKIADYFFNQVGYKEHLIDKLSNPKSSQFAQPLFEFSGACAGCGETPYIKLVTQMFGDRMVIANATGCTSIYGASFPATPYTTNKDGLGPAWANSLFEDNAEFGYGMHISVETLRDQVQFKLTEVKEKLNNNEFKILVDKWIAGRNSGSVTKEVSPAIIKILEKNKDKCGDLLTLKNYFIRQSNWIFGGDGWAYDIGYGGLDHVIANQDNVNILVVDTEVYSNTGGQSSKSSQTGSVAKFTASGKPGKKKDLAAIAISYGHVYVAQISHGANKAQVVKAMREAESYDGPSIIIAYSPCIAHGIKGGLVNAFKQAKLATECGYWPIFRYDPRLTKEGKNPLQIDSKEPNWDKYIDFLMTENRYVSIKLINKSEADNLLNSNMKYAKERYKMYKRYLSMDFSE